MTKTIQTIKYNNILIFCFSVDTARTYVFLNKNARYDIFFYVFFFVIFKPAVTDPASPPVVIILVVHAFGLIISKKTAGTKTK